MIIKPLIQLRQTVETTLRSMTNISKPFVTFFIETMEMYLSVNKKINFTQMARFGRPCESRFRDNVRLRYIYRGPKAHKRGRPKLYDGDIDSPDMNVFRKTEVSIDRECYTLPGQKQGGSGVRLQHVTGIGQCSQGNRGNERA